MATSLDSPDIQLSIPSVEPTNSTWMLLASVLPAIDPPLNNAPLGFMIVSIIAVFKGLNHLPRAL